MHKAILLTTMLIAVMSIGDQMNSMAMSLDLSQFQWKKRLLLLFAPNRSHPLFDTLHKALTTRKADIDDRDLVIFKILETGPSSMNSRHIDPQTAHALREKFEIPPGKFAVVLVGKDGGIKLDRQEQTELEDIFALIDSMPMRRQEMRK